MPSPFPGMDPYLERPLYWADFHDNFASEIRGALNRDLPSGYFAVTEPREEIGIVNEPKTRVAVPDVAVRKTPEQSEGGISVVEPRRSISHSVRLVLPTDRQTLSDVLIKRRGDDVTVTTIEILSPSNKRPGRDRTSLLRKRQDLLAGTVSVIEIDLLRNGMRIWDDIEPLGELPELDEPYEYLVTESRGWERGASVTLNCYPIGLQDQLPVVAVPLSENDPDVALDLQYCFREAYDSGPYRRGAVDYSKPPEPPLPEPLSDWARRQIDQWRSAAS